MNKILKSISLMSLMLSIAFVSFGSSITQAATYTLADVATHNTPSDCWVVVNSNVYNLTNFISSHSGGSSVIEAQCGKNGTAAFNSGPHSASTLNAISSYLLGTLTTTTTGAVLTSLNVTPTAPVIVVGGTVHIKANPKNQNGGSVNGTTITFASSNPAIATVGSTTGIVTGVSLGSTTITVTAVKGSVTLTGTSHVTVSETAPVLTLATVKIEPNSPSLKIGKTIQLIVKAKDQNGKKIEGATTAFSTSDSLIATVDSNTGLVTGVSIGSATITATTNYGDETIDSTVIVKVVDVLNHDNNGNHFGQFKNWFKKWFNHHKDNWENQGQRENKGTHENQNDDNGTEVEDD